MPPISLLHPCFRWLERQDLAAVLPVERACFEYAWTEADFLHCLRLRNCVGMVAEECAGIVGFMVYELHRSRIDLLNFAVAPPRRRHGIGGLMAVQLIVRLSSHGRDRIRLAVRETNLGAQLFFRAQGFRATGVLRGYYEDSGEDAYRMVYRHLGADGVAPGPGPFHRATPDEG